MVWEITVKKRMYMAHCYCKLTQYTLLCTATLPWGRIVKVYPLWDCNQGHRSLPTTIISDGSCQGLHTANKWFLKVVTYTRDQYLPHFFVKLQPSSSWVRNWKRLHDLDLSHLSSFMAQADECLCPAATPTSFPMTHGLCFPLIPFYPPLIPQPIFNLITSD